jgi:aspartyl-tRNA(Asn)/glutamyl-tRNA(Gln) amidotransferase subunit C
VADGVRDLSQSFLSELSIFMAQQLSLDQVKQVAALARLELSEAEESRLTGQLNDILLQFSRLQELDTTGVPPTSHSLSLENVFRSDVAVPSLPREAATANAPEKRDGNFIVPQIVEF